MFNFIKKHKIITGIVILIILGIIASIFFNGKKGPTFDTVTVEKGSVIQEVDVTGRVIAAEQVNLAFEKSGRLGWIGIKVGDKVYKGQTLATLSNLDAQAKLLQARAALQTEQSNLEALENGTRPEELQIANRTVETAERNLNDALTNLDQVKTKAEADLKDELQGAITAAGRAVTVAKNVMLEVTDLQTTYFSGYDQNEVTLADRKTEAMFALLGASSAGYWSATSISGANGGVTVLVKEAKVSDGKNYINEILIKTVDALEKTRDMVNAIPITSELTSANRTTIDTEKTSMTTEITTVTGKQQSISVQEATNSSAISTAQSGVNSAENTLASAQDNLLLKQAGSTSEQIAAQRARVSSAQAGVQDAEAQLAKAIITAPFSGTVTTKDGEIGEIIAANAMVVGLISDAKFEIETFIPEADIAKIKLKNIARVTLDAYGSETEFETTITEIDPAETMIEGVATYKVTLQFTQNDERVKSGMTANINIETDKRENVIRIPQRAIITKDGQKIVRVLKDDVNYNEVVVKTGLRGSDGLIEILEGLNEGNRVITFIKN